jgi:hypothetical protein
MVNGLMFLYYILSLIEENILPTMLLFAPAVMLFIFAALLNFTAHGKYISGAHNAKRFVKKSGMITVENGGIFFDKCIKRLPNNFVAAYDIAKAADVYTAFSEEKLLKPLFKGKNKIFIALYDGIMVSLFAFNIAVSLIRGETAAVILFTLIAPLPFIALNRMLFISLLYLYESRAKKAYGQLLSIIKNEWAGGRRFLKD